MVAGNRASCQGDTPFTLGPGAWGGAKSLIQVCCIYLPIVIIQHTSILSNCGNHTKVSFMDSIGEYFQYVSLSIYGCFMDCVGSIGLLAW